MAKIMSVNRLFLVRTSLWCPKIHFSFNETEVFVVNWLELYYNMNCIRSISETTGASSDVYCQSSNDNHIQTSCAFYVESIQVKHSRELGRKHRERYEILRIGERGRERRW
jgi:hypothetical protein